VREGFQDKLHEDVQDQGLDPAGLAMAVYPDALALPGSDLSVIPSGLDQIVAGLTK
jgi:hypothetical protein